MKKIIKELDKEIDDILSNQKDMLCIPTGGLNLRYVERLYWIQRLKEK